MVGLTLVTAAGEVIELSPEQRSRIFKAAQVSLGALGVIAAVTLRVVPAKRLRFIRRGASASMSCWPIWSTTSARTATSSSSGCPTRSGRRPSFTNETDARPPARNLCGSEFNRIVLENGLFWVLSEAARIAPPLSAHDQPASPRWASPRSTTMDYSHRVFATPRVVRFQEMEYNVPAEHFPAVLRRDRGGAWHANSFRVHFPIECRFVRGDDIWLSPAYGRDSAYIAVHMYKGMPYKEYFRAIEEIFQRYGGGRTGARCTR